jgi:hypothetical protein
MIAGAIIVIALAISQKRSSWIAGWWFRGTDASRSPQRPAEHRGRGAGAGPPDALELDGVTAAPCAARAVPR